MRDPKNNLNSLKKESEKSLEVSKNSINREKINERFHLNSLITKNISLFTKNPNYKMLAWLIVQLFCYINKVLINLRFYMLIIYE